MNYLKATALVATTLASASSLSAKSKAPNIVFLFSDDHAVKAIGAYGNSLNKTPNIDRIANEGAIFQNNFCANSICSPSRACILTGKHSHINGVTKWQHFDGSQFTFPKVLQKAGYGTGIFGKWHLHSNPTGFDEWMVYPGQGSYYNPDYIVPGENGKNQRKRIEGYSVDITTDLALDFIKRNKEAEKPFLVMCQYKAPHRTWRPAPKYLNMFDDVTFPEPDTLFDSYDGRSDILKQHRMGIDKHMRMGYDLFVPLTATSDWSRMTDEQKAIWTKAWGPKNKAFKEANLKGKELVRWKYQRYIKNYLRCVQSIDDNIGRILEFLKENDLEENTIVVYSSDQGFYLGEHGWFDKRWMFEESFRMPLVMKWPGVIKPGTKISELTQNIDFAPTFLEATMQNIPKNVQGKSMLSLMKGEKVEWRDALYYQYYDGPGEHGVTKHFGVRTDRYKLMRLYDINEWQMFDLKEDPNEMKSVYNSPKYAAVQKELHKKLDALRKKYKCSDKNVSLRELKKHKKK